MVSHSVCSSSHNEWENFSDSARYGRTWRNLTPVNETPCCCVTSASRYTTVDSSVVDLRVEAHNPQCHKEPWTVFEGDSPWSVSYWLTYPVTDNRIGLILDNGCKRNVAGSQWHKSVQEMLARHGLKGVRHNVQEEFLFGSDRVDLSKCAWEYPVGIHGNTTVLNIAEIDSNCPGLMSDATMANLDVSLHVKRQTYDLGVFGIKEYKHELSAKSRHAFIRTDWFPDLSKTHLDSKFFLETPTPGEERTMRTIGKALGQRLRKSVRFVNEVSQPEPAEAEPTKPPEVLEVADS